MEEVKAFTPKNFEKGCLKSPGLCVIAMFDGELDDERYQVLKKIQAQMKGMSVSFGWIDGVCQYELRDKMGISEVALPNLAVYSPSKKMAARLVGKFVEEDINDFLKSALRGKSNMFPYDDITLVERDCEALKASFEATEEDDEIIKEVLSQSEKIKTTSSSTKSKQRKKKKKKPGDL